MAAQNDELKNKIRQIGWIALTLLPAIFPAWFYRDLHF